MRADDTPDSRRQSLYFQARTADLERTHKTFIVRLVSFDRSAPFLDFLFSVWNELSTGLCRVKVR